MLGLKTTQSCSTLVDQRGTLVRPKMKTDVGVVRYLSVHRIVVSICYQKHLKELHKPTSQTKEVMVDG